MEKRCLNTGRTHFKKGFTPWNKGLKGYFTPASFKKGHKDLVPKKSRVEAGKKLQNELHPLWKEKVGYHALHSWVIRKLGNPNKCSECGLTSLNSRRFHWANISHEYKRDLKDWKRMCVKCHFIYDKHPYHYEKK